MWQLRGVSRALRSRNTAALVRSRYQPPRIALPVASCRSVSRWYSSTTAEGEVKTSEGVQEEVLAEGKGEAKAEDPKQKEIEALKKEILELKDYWRRSVADFRNLQETTKREKASIKDFANQAFAKDLLESSDTLDLALQSVPKEVMESNKDFKSFYGGIEMTNKVLMQALEKNGIKKFDPSENGDKFDPRVMEATFQTPVEGKEDGTVMMTQQKGYMLNGRVLRAAKVGVVKNP